VRSPKLIPVVRRRIRSSSLAAWSVPARDENAWGDGKAGLPPVTIHLIARLHDPDSVPSGKSGGYWARVKVPIACAMI